jgi:hypothetical protein
VKTEFIFNLRFEHQDRPWLGLLKLEVLQTRSIF